MSIALAPPHTTLNRLITDLSQSGYDRHDQLLPSAATASGETPVADATNGERVTMSGTLASVTLRPQGPLPVLQADLFDGSGHIQVVWLGRHRILGLVPGRGIRVTGRVGGHDPAHRAVFNPHYELLAPGPGR